MNFAIQITKNIINSAEVNSANAREIHDYLAVKTKFADWIKRAIEKYDFIEDQDYIVSQKREASGQTSIEYIVTLEMGKELAMLENNPKGKQVRKDFIYIQENAKEIIATQSEEIQILQGMLNAISKMDSRVVQLEQTRKLENWQEKQLIDTKNLKVYEIARKHDLENDKSMISKLHSRIWKAVKKKYNVPRYNEVPSLKFNEANIYIKNITFGELI